MPDVRTIDLWLVDERQVDDIALLEQYRQLMNAHETGRHQRFIFSLHRHQFLVARALVRSVLARYVGMDNPADLEFSATAHGKPVLPASPGLQFNLSHTNGLITLAVTRDKSIGVDVEHLSRQADIVRLADRYFSLQESRELTALPVEQWNQRFYDLWTLKEAYLKACGTGLRTPLDSFSFELDEDNVAIRFGGDLKDDPRAWQFWQLDAGQAFRVSLALNAPAGEDYTLKVRQGIPMRGFEEVAPAIVRRSAP